METPKQAGTRILATLLQEKWEKITGKHFKAELLTYIDDNFPELARDFHCDMETDAEQGNELAKLYLRMFFNFANKCYITDGGDDAE